METHRRGSDGRRLFTASFKQEQLARVAREELTLAELARELAISPSVVRRWQQLSTNGSRAAVRADEDVVPASALRAAQQRIKELERALGKKAMEIEILQAAREEVKKDPASTACPGDDGAEAGAHLPDVGDEPGVRVPGERRAASAVCARRRSHRDGADPRGDSHARIVRGTARSGPGQSGVCDAVQPQAHSTRDGAEWLEAPARDAAAHRARPPRPHPARRIERAVVQ